MNYTRQTETVFLYNCRSRFPRSIRVAAAAMVVVVVVAVVTVTIRRVNNRRG